MESKEYILFFGTFLCCSFWWFLDGKDILNVLAELNNMLKTAGQKLHFNIEQATHALKQTFGCNRKVITVSKLMF